ncbi:putative RNA recognition motif domain, nucleotide-binding alpha-beta plait domain superfamily [Helianthus annuus]|nr:putative RNA recognition motif domain, nucleotide-binding alpha-beta plait domain superfamily [Helianthus annuus]
MSISGQLLRVSVVTEMTIDDENSVYVGNLPYESTEDTIRSAFDIYGQIIAVKIINDRGVNGKCYGFVTFTNPRSAVNAISDMDGRVFAISYFQIE